MGLKKVIYATCGRGCTEMRTFAEDDAEEAQRWLRSHEKTHDNPVVYVGKHDPRVQARYS